MLLKMATKKVVDKLMLNWDAIYTANDWELALKLNGTQIGTFNANEETDKEINIQVWKGTVWLWNVDNTSDLNKPISTATQTALNAKQWTLTPWTWISIDANNEISTDALPWTTKYWASLDLSIDSTTYVITAQLKDQDWNNLWTAKTVDLPLESVVVSWSYNAQTKKVVLTLQDWSTIEFSVADLVSWLQSEITTTNKLDADLVDDSESSNKFVSSSEKTTWNNKQNALVSWTNIKTINWNSILWSGNLEITSWVSSVNWETWAVVLDADDIDDSETTNKFVSATEKQTWNNKADADDIWSATISINQAWVSAWSFNTNQDTAWTINLAWTKKLTQTEYNNLPSSKTSDNNLHIIYKTITVS